MLAPNSTRIDVAAVLHQIERRLTELNLSADKASQMAGKPDAIRNLRRIVKDGRDAGVNANTLVALEKALCFEPGSLAIPQADHRNADGIEVLKRELDSKRADRAAIDGDIIALQYALDVLERAR